MSDYLPAPRGGFFSSSLDRQASRAIDRVQAEAMVARSADRARIERIIGTTEYGMGAAAYLNHREHVIATMAPGAADEIHLIYQLGIGCIAGVVQRAGLGL